MRPRSKGWLLTTFVALVVGCVTSPAPDEDSAPYEQLIAVGARVELQLETCGGDRALLVCLPSTPSELQELSVAGTSIRVVSMRPSEAGFVAELEALEAGEGTLHVAYTTTAGRTETVERPLRAVTIDSVKLVPDCPLDRRASEPLLIGAGSELRIRLEPHARSYYQFIATGQLSLLDFAGFALVSAQNNEAVVRAPQRAGDYTWRDLTGTEHRVQVYDASSFPLQLQRASGTSARTKVSSDVGAAILCTASSSTATAKVQVTYGECAVGLGDVQVEPGLWLPMTVGGSGFGLYGHDTCVLKAQLGEGPEARLTTTLLRAADEGTLVDVQPVPFALPEKQPSTKCDTGITNGKCELLGFIPDADCLTDADWTVERFDSAGPIGSDDYIGTGLTFFIGLGVTVGPNLAAGHRAPLNVAYHYDERLLGLLASAADIHVSIGECRAPLGQTRVAQVRADALGPHQLEFTASNLNDTAEVEFATRGTDRCPIEASVGGQLVRGKELLVLEGSTVKLSARCERSDGLKLRGDAPLSVAREVAAPVAALGERVFGKARITNDGSLYVGAAPASFEVVSAVGAESMRIVVQSASEITSLMASPLTPAQKTPDVYCSQISELDVAGQALVDSQTARVRVTLPADGSWTLAPDTSARLVCVQRLASGTSGQTLTVRLGGAALDLPLP